MRSEITLRTRLVVLIMVALLPLFGLSIVKAVLSTNASISQASRDLEFTASVLAANQQGVADTARQLLTAVGQSSELTDEIKLPCNPYFKALKDQLGGYSNIGIIGLDGYLRCHAVDKPTSIYVGDRNYFKQALTQTGLVSGGYVNSRLSGASVMVFALPLINAQGSRTGIAFSSIYLSELAKSLAKQSLPKGRRAVITDRQGIVLAAFPASSAVIGQPVPSTMLQKVFKSATKGVREDEDITTGARQIYAFQPSDTTATAAFFVAVSVDRDEVVGPAERQLALEFVALALVAFLGSWLAWLMGGRVIVRPTAEILEATRQIQTGRLDVRIPLREGQPVGEFSRIADGFNRMVTALAQREHELATELAVSQRANAALAEIQLEQTASYAALRESQRKLLEALHVGCMGHLELDLATRRLTLSDELYSLFGLDPANFDGHIKTFAKSIHPQDRANYDQRRDSALREGAEFDVEYRIITPDGTVRWMHQRSKPDVTLTGDTVRRSGVVQDITERKQYELALIESLNLLRRTGTMAKVGGFELIVDGMQLNYSEQMLRISDLEPGAPFTLADAQNSYPAGAREVLSAALQAAIEQGTDWDLELPMLTATGRPIWVRNQGQAILREGQVDRVIGTVQDITEQQASQAHLRLLETCIARLNDIVLITQAQPFSEPGPRIVFVNDAFVRLTGYSREEVLGRSPRLLQGPNTSRAELQRIAVALEAGQPVRADLINYSKTGQEYWIELEVVPISGVNGLETHYVAIQRDISQRKLAEQALIDSEQRYAVLFELAPVPMWVYDEENLRFLTANAAAIHNYGYSTAEFLVMTIVCIHPAAERAGVTAQIDGTAALLKEIWQHQRKDGSLLMAKVISQPVQYAGRKARVVVAVDITDRIKAEKIVQEHLFSLQRSADAAQAIVWHQTLDGMLHEIAEQARAVLGAHQATVSLLHSSDDAQDKHAVSRSSKYAEYSSQPAKSDDTGIDAMVCETKRVARMTQTELETHPRWLGPIQNAGQQPPLRGLLAVPLTGRHGNSIGVLKLSDKLQNEFTLEDEYVAMELAQLASIAIENAQLIEQVSQLNAGLEQKVAERTAELARQEALFRVLSEEAPQVVWTINRHGSVTYFNRAWFELMGGEMADWSGDKWTEAIHPEDLPDFQARWETAVANQSPFGGTRRLRSKEGSYHTMTYRGAPVLDEHGEITFWVGIDADITEMKAIEAALRLSNQELEAFSYSVSHDLRSPLNTIDGFSRLLSKHLTGATSEKGQHYLTRIHVGVAQMGKLIEDLLSLAQVLRMQLHYEAVDLTALSLRILEEWRVRQPERQVTLHIENKLLAQGDARLIRVAMENLLGNAWKFTSKTAAASISVGQELDAAGQPVFFVSDNGVGFDMAYADKLFIAFHRLHMASEFPGTGIGLATVSRIIARHGGQVWANAKPGHGARIMFTLPHLPVNL